MSYKSSFHDRSTVYGQVQLLSLESVVSKLKLTVYWSLPWASDSLPAGAEDRASSSRLSSSSIFLRRRRTSGAARASVASSARIHPTADAVLVRRTRLLLTTEPSSAGVSQYL